MVKTIEQVLKPIYLVSFIFGFGILRYPCDYPRIHLSIFYILTIWSVYVYIFYNTANFFSPRSIFTGDLDVFLKIINILVTITSIINTFLKHKVHFFFLYVIISCISTILKTNDITIFQSRIIFLTCKFFFYLNILNLIKFEVNLYILI